MSCATAAASCPLCGCAITSFPIHLAAEFTMCESTVCVYPFNEPDVGAFITGQVIAKRARPRDTAASDPDDAVQKKRIKRTERVEYAGRTEHAGRAEHTGHAEHTVEARDDLARHPYPAPQLPPTPPTSLSPTPPLRPTHIAPFFPAAYPDIHCQLDVALDGAAQCSFGLSSLAATDVPMSVGHHDANLPLVSPAEHISLSYNDLHSLLFSE